MFEAVADTATLLEELAAAELQAGRAYLRQLRALHALSELSAQADLQQRTWSDVSAAEHALAEAALVLRLSSLSVSARLLPAQLVADHPLLGDLLDAGALVPAHVVVLAEELDPLDEELAARALHRLLLADPEQPGWTGTPGELRRAARRLVVQLDPEGAAERREHARRTASGVRYRALQDGLAALAATGAAAQLKAARGLIARLAEQAATEDDERTHGEREVDALLTALLMAARSRDLPAADLELQVEVPVEVTATRSTGPCTPPEPAVIRSHLTPELLADLLADAGAPHRAGGARPPTEPARAPAAQRTTAPAPAAPAPAAPAPELVGHGPVDPALLRALLTDPHGLPLGLRRVTVRRLCRDTASGQVVAVDARAVPLERLLRPAGATAAADRPRALLQALTDDLPAPPRLTLGYRPTAAQKRLVQARDVRCTFPGCGRPARQSQLDHLRGWPVGTTSVANLHPLCQHHHRLKHDGWAAHRHADGSTTWTSPAGQRARAGPRAALPRPGRSLVPT